MFDPLTVITTIPACAIRRTVSASRTHFRRRGGMENTRAVLLAAVLTVLPVAAYSQGTPAPADAFLYIIWPPDGATVKVRSGAGLVSATWVSPRRAAMLQT